MWLINIVFLQLPAKEGFPVIRVICHESVIYVTGHVHNEPHRLSNQKNFVYQAEIGD